LVLHHFLHYQTTPQHKRTFTNPIAWLRTTSFYLPLIFIFERTANKMLSKLCVILEKHEIDNEQKIENDLHTSINDLKLFLC
jgi:hypothetical protein